MKKSPKTEFKIKVLKDLATKDDYQIIQYVNPCIPWEQIDFFFNSYLTRKDREKFYDWMQGQTTPLGGVYSWDWIRYWQGASPMHLY